MIEHPPSHHIRPKKPELVAPSGSLEKCKVAFLYGADVVYVGGKDFSLRAYTRNLNREELAQACFMAHQLGKKLYVTVNVYAREEEISALPGFLSYLQDIRVDAIVVSDPGILLLVKRWAPETPVHLSTQSNTTNSLSVFFGKSKEFGASISPVSFPTGSCLKSDNKRGWSWRFSYTAHCAWHTPAAACSVPF